VDGLEQSRRAALEIRAHLRHTYGARLRARCTVHSGALVIEWLWQCAMAYPISRNARISSEATKMRILHHMHEQHVSSCMWWRPIGAGDRNNGEPI